MHTRSKRAAVTPVYPSTKRALYDGDYSGGNTQKASEEPKKQAEEEAITQPSFEVLIGGEPLDLNKIPEQHQEHHQSPAKSAGDPEQRGEPIKECPPAKFVQASQLIGDGVQTGPRSVGDAPTNRGGAVGVRLDDYYERDFRFDISQLRIDVDIIMNKLDEVLPMWDVGGRYDGMLKKLWALYKFLEERQNIPNRQWFTDPEVRRSYFQRVFNDRPARDGGPYPPKFNNHHP